MPEIPGAVSPMNDVEIDFDAPISEALMLKIAANINAVVKGFIPVGGIIYASLTEAEIQAQLGVGIILADGRNVAGSRYNTITGRANAPDLRGVFIRGKNNGRADGYQNPDGELALDTIQDESVGPHSHNSLALNARAEGGGPSASTNYLELDAGTGWSALDISANGGGFTGAAGAGIGNETRPVVVTENAFIRIN